jgi:hypothetical protein
MKPERLKGNKQTDVGIPCPRWCFGAHPTKKGPVHAPSFVHGAHVPLLVSPAGRAARLDPGGQPRRRSLDLAPCVGASFGRSRDATAPRSQESGLTQPRPPGPSPASG